MDPYPRHAYDCGHCALAWCCGPLCVCIRPIAPAPKRRAAYVERLVTMFQSKRLRARAVVLARRAKRRWIALDKGAKA